MHDYQLSQQLDLLALDYSDSYALLFDPRHYHQVDKSFGSFSFLMLRPGQRVHDQDGEQKQFSFPLNELPERIVEFVERAKIEGKNLFISQASFSRFNRRRANFMESSCLFLDLDIYKTRYFGIAKEQLVEMVYQRCEDLHIPEPSVFIDSGGGLYVKWFINPIESYALSYWERVQSALCEAFEEFGADLQALDISRVLRVVGSDNHKHHGTPMCRIINVNYATSSTVFRSNLRAFETILPYTLEEAQAFKERMAQNNARYRKQGNQWKRENAQGDLVWQAMRELKAQGFMETITIDKLHDYIKTAYQIARFPKAVCAHHLGIWKRNEAQWIKETKSTPRRHNPVANAKSRFNLKRRNWQSYKDLVDLAIHRYGNEGAPSGLKNEFMWMTCNQFALSEWQRKSKDIITSEWQSIRDIIAPDWSDTDLWNCLNSISKKLDQTIDLSWVGSSRKNPREDGGYGIPLYTLSDEYIKDRLNITSDELQMVNPDGTPLIREVLGESERNRRDPMRQERLKAEHTATVKRLRRANGVNDRETYEANRSAGKEALRKQVLALSAQGMKGKDIAAKLGIDAGYVSKLKKN